MSKDCIALPILTHETMVWAVLKSMSLLSLLDGVWDKNKGGKGG